MKNPVQWLQARPFETHLVAFFLMIVPSIPLYLAAQSLATGWIVCLLVCIILGNLMELIIQ